MAPVTQPPDSPTGLLEGLRGGIEYRTAHARADRALARIARSGKPVVAGPWLSEVGIELLFWIPLLRWWAGRHGVEAERLTAVSRGGARHWYAGLAGGYADVLDVAGPEDLREWQEERAAASGSQKQTEVAGHDRLVLERLGGSLPEDHELLHPSLMHTLYRDFWNWRDGRNKLATVLDRSRFAPIPRPEPRPAVAALPDGHVAVKAYFNNSFPDTDENRAFLRGLLERLAAQGPVVVLDTGLGMDDHADWAPSGAEVVSLAGSMTARDNLALQTETIAGARALYATIGGFSHLAAFLGVPCVAWNSADEHFIPTHHDLMVRVRRSLERAGGGAPFAHVSPATWPLLALG